MPNTLSVTASVAGAAPESIAAQAPERYVSRAFFSQYNLILLGGSVAFALAFASLVPLLVAAIGEVAWLGIGARSAAFRRWVEQKSAEERRGALETELANSLAGLDPAYHSRFMALGRHTEELTSVLAQLGMPADELNTATLKLQELRGSFVRLAAAHQRLARFVAETPAVEIEQEIARVRQQLAAEKDLSVRVSVRQSLALAERRLAQWEQIANMRRSVEVNLDTLEKSFAYLCSRAMTASSAAEAARDIDALLAQTSSVNAVEAETYDAMRY